MNYTFNGPNNVTGQHMYPIQYAVPPPQPGLPPQQQSQQQQQHQPQQQQQQQQQQAPSPQPQQQQPEQPFHGHLQYAAMNMINPHFHPGYPPTQAYAPPPQAGARYPPHYPPALPPHPMHMIPHVQQPPFYQNPYQPYLPPSHFYNPYQSQPLPPPLPQQQQPPLQPQTQQAPPPRFNVRNVHSSSPTPLSHIRPFVPQSQPIPPQSHYTPPPREETHRMSPAPLPTPPSEPQIGLTFAPPEERPMPNQERPTSNQQGQPLLVEATTIVTGAAAAAQPLAVSSPIAANRTPSPPLPPPVLPAPPLPALSPVRLTPELLPTTTTTTSTMEAVFIPPESPTTPSNTRPASEGGQPVELEEETMIGPTSTHPSFVFLTDDDSQSSVHDLAFTVVSFHPERIIDMNSVSSSLFISVGARLPEVFRVDALPPIPMENVDKQKKKKRKSVVKPSSSSSTSGGGAGGAGGKTKSKKGKRVFPANGRLVGTSSPLSSSSSSPGQNPNVAVAAVAVTTSSEESSTAGGRGGIAIIVEEEKEAGDANANVTNPTVVVSAEEGASEPTTTTTTAAVRPAPKPAPLTKSFASLLRRSGGGGGTGGGGEGSDGQQARPAFLPSSQVGFTVPAMGWSTSLSINNNAIGGGGGGGGAYSANGSGNDVEEQSAVASLTPHQHASLIRLLKTGVGIPAPTSSAAATAAAKKSTTTGSTSTSLKAPPSGQQLSSTASASSSSLSHPGSNAPQIVPRGLVNTGNLCFANAILQSLVYTPPFWKLFNDLGQSPLMRERRNARSRGATTTTPMVDAVIDFLNEFKPGPGPIDSTNFPTASAAASMPAPSTSEKQATSGGGTSRSVSKEPGALPRNSFKASGVYNSLKSNPHFDAMRLGQQEDAEEFLGFFLDGLHEEFGKLLSLLGDSSLSAAVAAASTGGGGSVGDGKSVVDDGMTSVDGETDAGLGGEEDSEWQEVGRKNRAMVTRTTKSSESAITSIFGGKIRSVLRASGRMDSASVEEWRCLQLDIQPQHVRSIEDALYGVSTIETVSIQSRQGHQVDATKQVFLEHLPPILVLQLKRFIYDPLTGIGKSTKHVQYGPELDIRSDLVSPNLKSQQGGRKYKLYGVIYHHGLSATGGHYTLDVLHPHPSMYATTPAPAATSTTVPRPKSNAPVNGTSQQQQPQTTEGWVRFNDESVRLLTPEDVFGKSGPNPNPNVSAYSASVAGTLGVSNRQYQEDRVAYLLLYRRVGR